MELVPSEITVAVGDAVNFTCSYESMHNLTISLQVNDNKAASISPRSHYSIPFQNRAFSIKKTATWTVVLNVPKSLDVICLLHNSANRLEKGKLISKLIPGTFFKSLILYSGICSILNLQKYLHLCLDTSCSTRLLLSTLKIEHII